MLGGRGFNLKKIWFKSNLIVKNYFLKKTLNDRGAEKNVCRFKEKKKFCYLGKWLQYFVNVILGFNSNIVAL